MLLLFLSFLIIIIIITTIIIISHKHLKMGCQCSHYCLLDKHELNAKRSNQSETNPIPTLNEPPNPTVNNELPNPYNLLSSQQPFTKDIDKLPNQNTISEKTSMILTNTPDNPICDYPLEMLTRINQLRQDPSSIIPDIETGMKYITRITKVNGVEKLIFNQQIKVALNRGEDAFIEAINDLKAREPLSPLEFKKSLCLPMPNTEEEMKDKELLKKLVIELKTKENVDNGWKDLISVPDISFLLMVVGDSGKKANMKRNDLLNPEYKYIGISSTNIGKHFLAYFMFSK